MAITVGLAECHRRACMCDCGLCRKVCQKDFILINMDQIAHSSYINMNVLSNVGSRKKLGEEIIDLIDSSAVSVHF